jgi:hypothetical protein
MIHTYKDNAGTVELTKADLELFSLTKIRVDTKCNMCQKEIKRGCYCLGKNIYSKYCLDCAPKLINNAVKSMNEYIKTFTNLKNILDKNKQEYVRNNLANSL